MLGRVSVLPEGSTRARVKIGVGDGVEVNVRSGGEGKRAGFWMGEILNLLGRKSPKRKDIADYGLACKKYEKSN